MLLPALVIGGPAVVGGELPNNKQGAKFTVSIDTQRQTLCPEHVAPKADNHDKTEFIIAQSVWQIFPFDQALHMR